MTILVPRRLRILIALCQHLEGINPSNVDPSDDAGGMYSEDLQDRIFRGRAVLGADVPVPALALLEAPQPPGLSAVGYDRTVRKSNWDLLLQGFVQDDKANPTDPAHVLMAKVEARLARIVAVDSQGEPLYGSEYLLGGLINNLQIGFGVARPPDQQVSAHAFFYIPLTLDVTSDVANPYGA